MKSIIIIVVIVIIILIIVVDFTEVLIVFRWCMMCHHSPRRGRCGCWTFTHSGGERSPAGVEVPQHGVEQALQNLQDYLHTEVQAQHDEASRLVQVFV